MIRSLSPIFPAHGVIAAALGLMACAADPSESSEVTLQSSATAAAPAAVFDSAATASARAVAGRRVYFGHQSVGANVVAGLEELLAKQPDLGLKIVMTKEPSVLAGPAFVHFYAGRNEHPDEKNADFIKVLDARPAPDDGIALLKYCYVDVDARTDIQKLFADYQRTVAEVRRKHPDVTIVHVTMPLTTVESANKARIKQLLGKPTVRDVNAKRNAYNAMLRKAYAGEPLFDLAALESTHADGRRSFFTAGGDTIYTLAEEFTYDGGHLSGPMQRLAAQRLIEVLATVASGGR